MGRPNAKVGWEYGSFTVLPSGQHQYRFYFYDEYHMKRRKSFTGEKSDCVAKAKQFCESLIIKKHVVNINSTICEILINKYKQDLEKNYMSEAGYARNIESLKKVKKSSIGRIPIKELAYYDIERFYATLSGYSDSVIEKTCGQIKLAFKIARREGVVSEDIFERYDIRRPKSRKQTKKVSALTEEEQNIFVEALKNHKVPYGRNSFKNQLLIELYTGMRMGEINALRPKDIDFKHGVIKVRGTISKGLDDRHYLSNFTKTEAGRRDVPMNALVKPVLQEAIAAMKPNEENLIFFDHNRNGVLTTNEVCSFYRRICEKCGIEYNGQHALRHTFATRCIEAEVPAVVLKTWLGHTDIHVTLDTYSDVYSRMNNSAMNKFEEHLDTISKEVE